MRRDQIVDNLLNVLQLSSVTVILFVYFFIFFIFFIFRPEFNFTSQYLVRVDDFFLHYLQKVRNLWIRYFNQSNFI